MTAGQSALRRSQTLTDEAEALFALSEVKRREARNYLMACHSEEELAGILQPLEDLGWVVLADRLWPGSKRANVDFILVGPGGVLVLDAKSWAEVEVRDSTIFRGQSDEREEVEKLISLADRLADALNDTGLTSSAISVAMVFSGRSIDARVGPIAVVGDRTVVPWIAGLRVRLDAEQVSSVSDAVMESCPEMPTEPARRVVRPRVVPRHRQEGALAEPLIDVDELTQAMLESALAGPIEDWMTFLHPEQNRLVRTQWSGAARVRGPAGTGKTVVGLHRAVHLATRAEDPVLFVSYVKTLPAVLGAHARRLSEAASRNIHFVGVHKLAADCLERTGQRLPVNPSSAGAAFSAAWVACGAAATLTRLDERPSYWREEIDHVIKGRGITEFDRYRDLLRVGRRTRMGARDREAMWDLYVAYEAELTRRNASDFNDLLLRARVAVDTYPDLFRYSTVIVDEVQDLNLAALQLLTAIAGDRPNSLLIIGDGQQSVYPGGFTLGEAGINVAGRAVVLRNNYRNTAEILAEANRVVAAEVVEDLDGVTLSSEDSGIPSRHGHIPMMATSLNKRDLDLSLVSMLERSHASGIDWGDLAVLAERRHDVDRYTRLLSDHGIDTVNLEAYDGEPVDRVKIGTIKRAKGLEFKYVLLPGVTQQPPDAVPGETADSHGERSARWRREMFVAMTRARDGLWLGYLS